MTEETGWLIEYPLDPRYGRESWYSGKDGFTLNSLLAIRYSRKEDAVREIDRLPVSLGKSLVAAEHAWVAGSLCMVGAEERNNAARARRTEDSLQKLLKARDEQTNHAIRVNREEVRQEGRVEIEQARKEGFDDGYLAGKTFKRVVEPMLEYTTKIAALESREKLWRNFAAHLNGGVTELTGDEDCRVCAEFKAALGIEPDPPPVKETP